MYGAGLTVIASASSKQADRCIRPVMHPVSKFDSQCCKCLDHAGWRVSSWGGSTLLVGVQIIPVRGGASRAWVVPMLGVGIPRNGAGFHLPEQPCFCGGWEIARAHVLWVAAAIVQDVIM